MLILDEATSALDNITEKGIMNSISNLDNGITVIMVAHRLSTVKNCDKIFVLNKGKIKDDGTFDELNSKSELFKLFSKNV